VFFEKLHVIDESIAGSELAPPFDILLSQSLFESTSEAEPAPTAGNGDAPVARVLGGAKQTLRALTALSVKELNDSGGRI
jgi:hypothetical protein